MLFIAPSLRFWIASKPAGVMSCGRPLAFMAVT
jgi:hypothetical protein